MTRLSIPERTAGDVLDRRYRLVERLGRGGFGDVWRAEELLPDGAPFRDVALKLLAPDFADAARWSEEAKLLASFRHPSLVTVYAAGEIEGPPRQPFVAMELLLGDTLADVIARRRRVPWRRVLAWARDTAAALDVIHERGVIHLDLKPANLFLSNDGALKVLDFGISRRSTSALAPLPARSSAPSGPGAAHGRGGAFITPATMGRGNAGITARGYSGESIAVKRTPGGSFFPSLGRASPLFSASPTGTLVPSTGRGAATGRIAPDPSPRPPPAAPTNERAASDAAPARAAAAAPPPAPAPALGGDVETAVFMAERDASAPEEKAGGTSAQKSVAGTPGFMAPEIIEMAEPTAATDAYSLAVCIVQLATGRLPQDVREQPEATTDPNPLIGWLSDIRGATLRGEMRDLLADPAFLPRGLVHLLHRLLAIDPAQRGVEPGTLRAIFDEVWERPYGVSDPPYSGLLPFTEHAEGTLFGREEDITRLGRELTFEPSLVLLGPRGTGKSSLAKAGLVPDLARRGVDEKDDWIAADVEPGDDPDQALDDAMSRIAPELVGADADALFAWCESSPVGVAIVVDSIEQIATAAPEKRERISAILGAIATSDKRPGVRLLGIVSEGRAPQLLEIPLGAALRRSLRYVGPPGAAAMDDIVLGPAQLAGAEITDADAVIDDVQLEMRAGDNHLPFVAIALQAWWSTREANEARGELILRGEKWRAMGGVAGALAAHADAVVASISLDLHHVVDEIFLRLSTTSGAPIHWKESDLIDTLGRDARVAPQIIEILARTHLVRAQQGEVRIGHPSLLKSWPRLTSARLREMDRMVFLERLREAREAWIRADRPKDLLLQGPLLREARERGAWIERSGSPADRELVESSVRASRIRAAQQIAAGVAVVLVVVGAFLIKRSYDKNQLIAEAAVRAEKQRADTLEIVSKSRRAEDPFQKAALISEAMRRRSTDGSLPLDLASAVANVPRARFLTLDPITGPTFPWNDRWLIGSGPGSALTIVDMQPPDSDVIEDMNLDADPDSEAFKSRAKRPKVIPIRPHAEPVVERVPFSFDTSFATRSVSGEVRVWRLRANGTAALAAIAPMRCASSLHIAAAAPVIACSTDAGIARWDLRRASEGPAAVDSNAFTGAVLDVSPDGARVAATIGRRVLLWDPHSAKPERREAFAELPEPVLFARYSPRDRVVLFVHATSFGVVREDQPDKSLISGPSEPSPAAAHWDNGGLDVAICNATGGGDWHYLRNGIRPKAEPPPEGPPCGPLPKTPIATSGGHSSVPPAHLIASDEVPEVAGRDLGTHSLTGGFRLSNGRVLTRDLVLFSGGPPVGAMLRFRGLGADGAEDPIVSGDSVANVARVDNTRIAFEISGEVRIYNADSGKRERARRGSILRLCADGRLLSWKREKETWRVFDALGELPGVVVAREPGLVLGADATCSTLLTQRLDGTILATALPAPGSGSAPEPLPPGRPIATADGYVYAVSPSAARAPLGSGLWLALSSGALARYDDKSQFIRVLGYATPRATAMGDGPGPGDFAFADATGVLIRRLGGQVERVLEGTSGASWEDLSVAPDGSTMLLCSGERLAALDIGKREIVADIAADGRSRFTAWDADGSVMAWTFDRIGGAEGQIIPRGLPLAMRVADAASNLRWEGRHLIAKP